MIKKLIFLFVLSTVFIYSQNNRLDFTVEEVNQLLYKASSSIQPADTTALMFRVRQEALAKMNYADTSFLFDRAKTFIKDSLNTIRTDLDVVRNEVNQRLTSTQIKTLVSDSLDIIRVDLNTIRNEISLYVDTTQIRSLLDSLSIIRGDLNTVSNNLNTVKNITNQHLDSIRIKFLISDSLNIVKTDLNLVKNEVAQRLDSLQVKSLISDSLNIVRFDLDVIRNDVSQHLDTTEVKFLISDSLNTVRNSLDIVNNEVNQRLDSVQVKSLILDSLNANTRNWQSKTQVSVIIRDSLNANSKDWQSRDQVSLMISQNEDSILTKLTDSLNVVRTDLDIIRNEANQHLNSAQVKSLISDSLSLVRNDINIIRTEVDQSLDSTQVKSLISDSLNANSRNWQDKAGVSAIIEDSLNTNARGWQTLQDVSTIVSQSEDSIMTALIDSLNLLKAELDAKISTLEQLINTPGVLPDYLTLSFTDVNFDTVTTYDDASGNLYTVLNITNDSSDIIGIENTHGLETPFYADNLDHIYVNTGERRIVNIYTTSTKPDNSYIDTLFITTTEKITQKVTVRFAVGKWYVDPYAINGKNDGTSWENAWTSFDSIDWTAMQGSDSIFISGGIDSVVYNTTGITIKGNNITIAKGTTPGHNGRVIFNASNIGSDTAVYLDEKKNVTIDGLEFVNYGKGVFMKSRNPAGVENIFIKNCKMYFTVDTLSGPDNDIKFVGTDHGGTSDTNSFNRFNSIHIVNNEFTSPEWSTSSIHILNLLNSWNVYIVGNKFINQNNNPDVNDYWYYSNTTHSYLLRNLFYYHDAKARPGGISSSYGIYGSEKAGYNVIAFNIFVTTDSIFYPPIYEVYYPISYPTVFRRGWERLIVVNNTFFGSQRKINYGSDINAYVANNIFYRSNTAINGGAGYIEGSEIGNPVLDSIRYNAFVDFAQGDDLPAWVSGYSNSSLPASNYARRANIPSFWYDVFISGLLKLSEPDPVVKDYYFKPNVTKPFYIDGEDMQTIIPQKVIDSNMKEPGLSWFEYYWNNAADYYSNPYRNKVGAIQI